MSKFAVFVSMIFFSISCGAISCVIDKKAIIERSNKYLKEVEFKITKDNSSFDVSFSFPPKIEGLEFSSVILMKNYISDKEVDLAMPLNIKLIDGRVLAWYIIKPSLAEDNHIEIVYGSSCGAVLQYKLDYQNESLKPIGFGL